jgi:F-type H+-transporting ATPase subunit c
MEDLVVSKRTFWTTALMVMAGVAFPLYAQGANNSEAARIEIIKWSLLAASFPLGFAAAFGALGQGKAIAAAAEAIARNPSATGDIRGALILGLVLIESLVIYVLLISLILFFLPPFGSVVAK